MKADDFFTAMNEFVPEDARMMLCQFRGDPNEDIKGKWRAKVLSSPEMVDEGANVYVCVSAMKKNARDEFRRRKENFAGGILLMIDDIGTGLGAKFPMSVIDPLPPTAMVETSPDNYQAMYFFDSLVTDMNKFDALIKAFIEKQFLGNDTGQAGVNRVFRPPAGVNGKPKYKSNGKLWTVKLSEWHPERRYSVEQIAQAFGLTLIMANRKPRDLNIIAGEKADRMRAFVEVRASMRSASMLKSEVADYSDWIPVVCPWTGNHTGGVDNGAAIRLPNPENEWFGAFRCHHGGCDGKGWRELTDWLADEQGEILEMINDSAEIYKNYNWN